MPILLVLLVVAVFLYLWIARRNSTLTRNCRWRLDRSLGANCYRCASCGAQCDAAPGKTPKDCLRPD